MLVAAASHGGEGWNSMTLGVGVRCPPPQETQTMSHIQGLPEQIHLSDPNRLRPVRPTNRLRLSKTIFYLCSKRTDALHIDSLKNSKAPLQLVSEKPVSCIHTI